MAGRTVGRALNGQYVGEEATPAQKAAFAEMLAARRAPSCVTDDTVFRGWSENPFADKTPDVAAELRRQASEMGISTDGKKYISQLVRPEYKGRFDPAALVGTRGDIQKQIDTRGIGVDGLGFSVDADHRDCPIGESQPYEPAPSLVQQRVLAKCLENPDVAPTPKEKVELYHQTKQEITGEW